MNEDRNLILTRVRQSEGGHGLGYWIDTYLAGEPMGRFFSRHEPTKAALEQVADRIASSFILPSEEGGVQAEREAAEATAAADRVEALKGAQEAREAAEREAAVPAAANDAAAEPAPLAEHAEQPAAP